MEFKDRIRSVRGGLKQQIFADKLGVHITTVQGWESGKNFPNGDILLRIHEEFGTDINWLLTGKGESSVSVDNTPPISEPRGINYGKIDSSFGTAADALKEIFDSHDPILIDAVRANLSIFRLYAQKDRQIDQQSQEIQKLKKEYDEVKKSIDALKIGAVGDVRAGSGSHVLAGDATRKKES